MRLRELQMKKLIIEKDKLVYNINLIKSMTESSIIAVLKGNGYGVGIVELAHIYEENGISFFAVSEIEEAVCLRNNGFNNEILLLTPTNTEEEAELIVRLNITPTIASISSAVLINETAKRNDTVINAHLKLDTGFSRFGFLPAEVDSLSSFIKSLPNIEISGTYTHLSFSFAKKPEFTYSQYQIFMDMVQKLNKSGISTGKLHICNSCAFLQYKDMHLDAVRVGSAVLGRIPLENKYGLQKVGYLKSAILEIKNIPAGSTVGYANTYRTKKPITVGIIPVGYKDGFGVEKKRDTFRFIDILRYVYNDLKQFNRQICVKINGNPAPIIGRINMHTIAVNLDNVNAQIGDEVILEINPILVNSSVEREFIGDMPDKMLVN